MKFQAVLLNLLLSLVSLCIFVLLVELMLQMVVPLFKPRFTKIDSVVGWVHYPSAKDKKEKEGHIYHLSYNSHGYRVPEHTYEKPEGVLRIVVLGDSFVDGSEVGDEETFTWHLQAQLKDIEVINLGVYGYSTAQELITLKRVGLKYGPDLVILFTMTNDYTDNLLNVSFFGPPPRYVLRNDSLEFESTDHPLAQANFRATNLPIPGMHFFHRQSYLYYFINHYLYQPIIAKKINGIIIKQKSDLDEVGKMALYYRLVAHMKELCDNFGSDLLVVFAYPQKYLIENSNSPSSQICNHLTAMGIANLDLFNSLREEELRSDNSLYYVKDFHWNPRGHEFVAEVLGKWIEFWMKDKQTTTNEVELN